MGGGQLARGADMSSTGGGAWIGPTIMRGLLTPGSFDIARLGIDALASQMARQQRPVTGTQPPPARPSQPAYTQFRAAVSPQQPAPPDGFRYGNLYAPPPDDLAELRR